MSRLLSWPAASIVFFTNMISCNRFWFCWARLTTSYCYEFVVYADFGLGFSLAKTELPPVARCVSRCPMSPSSVTTLGLD